MREAMLSVGLAVSAIWLMSWAWKAFCWVWLNPKRLEKYLRKQGIKGPSYSFLFGNAKEIVSLAKEAQSKPMEFSHRIQPRVLPFFHQAVQQYGKTSFAWFGPIPCVTLMDPTMIKDVLSDKLAHFRKTQSPSRFIVRGLVSYDGDKWAKHRKIINPAFHQEKLKMMLPDFYTCCDEMVSKWQKLAFEEPCELDVWPHLQNLTVDAISRTAFGAGYEAGRRVFELQNELAELLIETSIALYIPGFRFIPTKRNNRMKEIQKEVRGILVEVISRREDVMKQGEAHNGDLLGLLMESNFKEIKDNNGGLTVDDVIEECKLFYFAGQETTAALLVWTMIVLSTHRDWQEKAREEVLQIFGKQKPDFEGLSNLKIVTNILYEVLRLYPPIIMLLRSSYKSMKVGETILPPGIQVAIPTLLVHHDRDLWGEGAGEFNPERFSGGISKATKNQLAFSPFGWGHRICVGQTFAMVEAKMAIAMILQRFSFELSSTYVHAPYSVLTLQPQHGARLVLRKI